MSKTRISAFLALMVILLSTSLPSAEASKRVSIIDIREEVKDGWHQTYEAHGRTIVVDVEIDVPKVDAVPILRVGFPPQLEPHNDSGGYVASDLTGIVYAVESSTNAYEGPGDPYEITEPDARADNSPLTLEEAKDFLEELIHGYESQTGTLDILLRSYLVRSCCYKSYEKSKNQTGIDLNSPTTRMGTYFINYYQLFHGIPYMLSSIFALSYYPKVSMESPQGTINGTIASKEDFSLVILPAIETGILKEDVALALFSEAKEQFEALIKAGLIREVYSVRFGYYCYVDPEAPGEQFILQPIWQLRGAMVEKASYPDPTITGNTPEYTRKYDGQYSLVDAQTGERVGEKPRWEYADSSQWK
jgi:hypothetical protein